MPSLTTRTRNLILAGIVGVIALISFGVVQWNSYQQSLKVVDSCGNTAGYIASSHLFQPCATVSGRVSHVTALPNGNLEVQLKLGRSSDYAINTANQGLQNGGLLVILPCGTATDLPSSYFQTCAAYKNTDIRPAIQTPLTYTGNLVINQKFGWIEMHPATDAPGV